VNHGQPRWALPLSATNLAEMAKPCGKALVPQTGALTRLRHAPFAQA
jgi:hypothetical protein